MVRDRTTSTSVKPKRFEHVLSVLFYFTNDRNRNICKDILR